MWFCLYNFKMCLHLHLSYLYKDLNVGCLEDFPIPANHTDPSLDFQNLQKFGRSEYLEFQLVIIHCF